MSTRQSQARQNQAQGAAGNRQASVTGVLREADSRVAPATGALVGETLATVVREAGDMSANRGGGGGGGGAETVSATAASPSGGGSRRLQHIRRRLRRVQRQQRTEQQFARLIQHGWLPRRRARRGRRPAEMSKP